MIFQCTKHQHKNDASNYFRHKHWSKGIRRNCHCYWCCDEIFIEKRKFNRRNWAGGELFKSYGRMRVVALLERLGGLIGLLLIMAE